MAHLTSPSEPLIDLGVAVHESYSGIPDKGIPGLGVGLGLPLLVKYSI